MTSILKSSKTVTSQSLELFTESFGSPDDIPVVLVMGATASAVWWPDAFCAQLASLGRYVIRYDHRDTGRSTSYTPGEFHYSVEDLADDVVRVMEGYNLTSAHLVGMSLGGFLSQLVVLKQPDRVRSLTLISSERLADTDPNLPGMDPSVLEYFETLGEVDWSNREAVVENQVTALRLFSGSAHPFDDAAIREMARMDFDTTPDITTGFNHASLTGGDKWLGRLNEISVPTLIIHGTEDPVIPYAHGQALQSAIAGARLVTLEGSGHELHREDWPVMILEIEKQTAF
ncbi:alpha/beta fold hydrolase [Saccharospirillum alexandrii]|uniref:alpha/beta fold hydrolase n=1 Tax=Saccharospirillum alexandrii TaxID=2448477 RepID=UPI000FD6E866|nr:alpha/beta fold hydrolase [Saccharospirillum alexandrii]